MAQVEPEHPAALPPQVLLTQCKVSRLRRSGPGGQHRNKVQTAVRLEHAPTGVRAEASERRSQSENQQSALFRLRVNLALQVRRASRGEAAPSALWRSRCRAGRLAINPRHDDFPALLAEVLDVLHVGGQDAPAAAATLGCTASQLTRLLRLEPRALAMVNEARRQRGLHALR